VATGPRARIYKANIGPYTSIGADVTIESVEVEHSIVLEGPRSASSAPAWRAAWSPGARVTRAFRVPRAVSPSIGGDPEIAMD
jgi:hypothetical protein